MSYDFSFDRKSAFLIVVGCIAIGTLLFLAGLVVGWDRGAAQARLQLQKENASKTTSTATPPLLRPAANKAAPPDSQKPSSGPTTPSSTSAAAASAKPPAQPSPPTVKQASSNQRDDSSSDAGAFSLQLGAFQSQDNATRLKKDLEARGYSAFVFDTLDAGGHVWHAVRVGHFPDLQKASAAAEVFAGKEKIPVVVRRGNEL